MRRGYPQDTINGEKKRWYLNYRSKLMWRRSSTRDIFPSWRRNGSSTWRRTSLPLMWVQIRFANVRKFIFQMKKIKRCPECPYFTKYPCDLRTHLEMHTTKQQSQFKYVHSFNSSPHNIRCIFFPEKIIWTQKLYFEYQSTRGIFC